MTTPPPTTGTVPVDEPVGDAERGLNLAGDESADAGEPAAGRWRRTRSAVAEALFPDAVGRSARWWAVVGGFVMWSALFALRVPWPSTFQRVWAEDGAVFLNDQSHLGWWTALFRGYAGYMQAVPRTATALVSLLPVTDLAAGLVTATAVVVGGSATLVAVVLRDITGRSWVGVLAATYFVAAPLGYETLGNLANLQWRLLPTALLVALWTPRTRWGVGVATVVLLAAATTSPFGVLALVVLAVRLLARPTWTAAVLAAGTAVGTVMQVYVVLHAPERQFDPVPGVRQLADQYALRVVGNSVLGEQTVVRLDLGLATRVGQGLLLVVLGLLLVAAVRGGRLVTLRVVGVGLMGVATYLAPMALSAPALDDSSATRYYVAPAALLVVTLLVACGPRTSERPEPWTWRTLARAARSSGRAWWTGPVGAQLPATVALVLVMTGVGFADFELPATATYEPVLDWDTGLARARVTCAVDPGGDAVIPTNPPSWVALLPCSDLR